MPLSLLIYVESASERDLARTAVRGGSPFHHVSETLSPGEANRQMRESQFDAAVVDLDGEGGADILRTIRQNAQHCHIPIVGLTRESHGPSVERLLTGTLDSMVRKPVEPGVLREELRYIAGAARDKDRR
jgi:CheY-like chemotaxis protein